MLNNTNAVSTPTDADLAALADEYDLFAADERATLAEARAEHTDVSGVNGFDDPREWDVVKFPQTWNEWSSGYVSPALRLERAQAQRHRVCLREQ